MPREREGAGVRRSGLVASARGLVSHGHVCWSYPGRGDFRARAGELLTDARAAGLWVEFVGSGNLEALREELAGIDGGRQLLDSGHGCVSRVEEFYEFADTPGGVVDPRRSVDKRVEATEKALAAGYTGVQAIVDCTAVARSAPQRDAFARYEHLLDRQMTGLACSALCGYDETALGEQAVAELACLHPLANRRGSLFCLYADDGVDFALGGEIDMSCEELFATTLQRLPAGAGSPELVVGGRDLQFIDHRGLLKLAAAAGERGATLVLRTAWAGAARIVDVLNIPGVRVESPA